MWVGKQLKAPAEWDAPEGLTALPASWEGRVKGCPVSEVLVQEVKSEGQIRDTNSLPAWGPFPCPSHPDLLPLGTSPFLLCSTVILLGLTPNSESEGGGLWRSYCCALGLSFPYVQCIPLLS